MMTVKGVLTLIYKNISVHYMELYENIFKQLQLGGLPGGFVMFRLPRVVGADTAIISGISRGCLMNT